MAAEGNHGPTEVAPTAGRAGWLLTLLMLALPAVFFDWALPFLSDTTLGNDYGTFSLPQQLELQFSIANGSFPLFVPGFAGGQTAQAMVLGQLHHPLAWLAAHLPGYWSGYALECNTLLRLLSLGLAHLVLFVLLCRLGLGRAFAFLLALITTYNLRMLDLFRYGAALEAWTGHLFLCAFIGLYWLDRASSWARAGMIGATYWLATSGHPQMAYYGGLGALLFTVLVPFLSAALDSGRAASRAQLARFWAGAAAHLGLGLLLASCFVVPFASEFFAGSSRSAAGQDLSWALAWLDSLSGTLNNLFLPLRADVHGAFGGSSLLVLVAVVPAARLFRVRVPPVVWAAWALSMLVFLALQGDRMPVYGLLWRLVPFLASMRTPGRLALLLPVLTMCVLAWLFAQVQRSLDSEADGRPATAGWLGLVGLVASVAYLLLYFHAAATPSDYSPIRFNRIPTWVEASAVAVGLGCLSCFAGLARWPRWRAGLVAGMCLCACLQAKLVIAHGTWRETVGRSPTWAQWAAWKRDKLDYRFASGDSFHDPTLWRQTSQFHVEPRLGRVYFQWREARDLEDAYRILGEGVGPQELVVEEPPGVARPPGEPGRAQVKLASSSLNRLDFDVQSSHPGYFTLSYPYTGRWVAYVDGVALPPRRANGGNHAVPIPAGRSALRFEYHSPGQRFGWGLSGLGLVLAAFVLVYPVAGGRRALAAALAAAVVAGGTMVLLERSLYRSRDYATAYTWSGPEPAGPSPNWAYGRRTSMSSTFNLRHNCCPFVGSKGTDGDARPRTGFMTDEEDDPRWAVDLGHERSIGSVRVFESRSGAGWNLRPLVLSTSRDGRTWSRAGAAFTGAGGVLRLALAVPVSARFVALQATGRCRLAFDEVEVSPPAEAR